MSQGDRICPRCKLFVHRGYIIDLKNDEVYHVDCLQKLHEEEKARLPKTERIH